MKTRAVLVPETKWSIHPKDDDHIIGYVIQRGDQFHIQYQDFELSKFFSTMEDASAHLVKVASR